MKGDKIGSWNPASVLSSWQGLSRVPCRFVEGAQRESRECNIGTALGSVRRSDNVRVGGHVYIYRGWSCRRVAASRGHSVLDGGYPCIIEFCKIRQRRGMILGVLSSNALWSIGQVFDYTCLPCKEPRR